MREQLFVDTLFVVAVINNRDQYHQQAVEISHRFAGWPLVTTEAVLFEIGNALSRGFKAQGIEIIEAFLSSEDVNVPRLTPTLFSILNRVRSGFDPPLIHKRETKSFLPE